VILARLFLFSNAGAAAAAAVSKWRRERREKGNFSCDDGENKYEDRERSRQMGEREFLLFEFPSPPLLGRLSEWKSSEIGNHFF
jgi:hypothetical protein